MRKMILAGALTAIAAAGASVPAGAVSCEPSLMLSGLSSPVGMAFDKDGNLLVAEWSAGRVTRIAPDGGRTVLASGLSGPSGLAIDDEGHLFVASYSRSVIWEIHPDGRSEVALEGLATPAGIGFDRDGRMMIANRRTNQILVVNEDGGLEPLVENLSTPVGVVERSDGSLVISNIAGGITVINAEGRRTDIDGVLRQPAPGIVVTPDDRVFVQDYGGSSLFELVDDTTLEPVAEAFSSPVGLAVAPDGSLRVASWGGGTLHRVCID